jgi:hypothetical protein
VQHHRGRVPRPHPGRVSIPPIRDRYPVLAGGSHNDFQRTRGVLRLLASIVGDLWQQRETTRQTQPCSACHVRWTSTLLCLTGCGGATYGCVVAPT